MAPGPCSPSPRRLSRLLFAALVLAPSGCGGAGDAEADAPRWIRLATRPVRFDDRTPGPIDAPQPGTPNATLQGVAAEDGRRLAWKLPPEAWSLDPMLPGVASTTLSADLSELTASRPQLSIGGRRLELRRAAPQSLKKPAEGGVFAVLGPRLLVLLPEGGVPTETVEFTLRLGGRSRTDGVWRAGLPAYRADGFQLLTGDGVESTLRLPSGAALSFGTAAVALHDGAAPAVVSVELDGEPIARSEAPPPEAGPRRTRVELPPDAREGATLRFVAAGGPAIVSVLEPVVGPAEFGTYGDRPWSESRPDLVVLLPDTFRADNMTLYRGSPGGVEVPLTPRLDDLAERSVRFRYAWSTAPWTLPAQASLLTGLEPLRHGAVHAGTRLPLAIETLAERLSEVGYRTGNVNDRGFVSSDFGLDQGFQRHDERVAELHDIGATRERVEEFLAADDGRPVFLYVQSYRAHGPYWATDESRALVEDSLEVAEGYHEGLAAVWEAVEATIPGPEPDPPPLAVTAFAPTPEVDAALANLQGLYRAGVRDTDAGFGAILDTLDGVGLDRAYVLFTSDHGEAFGEHRLLMHKEAGNEAVARVPLLLRGPDLEPRTVEEPVSLLDVAPTFAELVGLERSPLWRGTSLLAPPDTRALYVEECSAPDAPQSWVGLLGITKQYTEGRYEVPLQIDLAVDPTESRPTPAGAPGFDVAVAETLERERRPLTGRLHAEAKAELTEAARARLRAIGYVEDGDED